MFFLFVCLFVQGQVWGYKPMISAPQVHQYLFCASFLTKDHWTIWLEDLETKKLKILEKNEKNADVFACTFTHMEILSHEKKETIRVGDVFSISPEMVNFF